MGQPVGNSKTRYIPRCRIQTAKQKITVYMQITARSGYLTAEDWQCCGTQDSFAVVYVLEIKIVM